MAKSDHLKLQIGASSEAGKKAVRDGKKDFAYDPEVTEHRPEKRGILRRTVNLWEAQHQFWPVAQSTDLDIPSRRAAEIRSEGKWP